MGKQVSFPSSGKEIFVSFAIFSFRDMLTPKSGKKTRQMRTENVRLYGVKFRNVGTFQKVSIKLDFDKSGKVR
jgi:hypothetical protein